MKIKVSELEGITLDWAVAKCEGGKDVWFDSVATFWIEINGKDRALRTGWAQSFTPSSDWAQGGPIIEREDINVNRLTRSEVTESGSEIYRKDGWTAFTTVSAYWITPIRQYGPTPLIAAMRCFCYAKLGDDIDVPEELL